MHNRVNMQIRVISLLHMKHKKGKKGDKSLVNTYVIWQIQI